MRVFFFFKEENAMHRNWFINILLFSFFDEDPTFFYIPNFRRKILLREFLKATVSGYLSSGRRVDSGYNKLHGGSI